MQVTINLPESSIFKSAPEQLFSAETLAELKGTFNLVKKVFLTLLYVVGIIGLKIWKAATSDRAKALSQQASDAVNNLKSQITSNSEKGNEEQPATNGEPTALEVSEVTEETALALEAGELDESEYVSVSTAFLAGNPLPNFAPETRTARPVRKPGLGFK